MLFVLALPAMALNQTKQEDTQVIGEHGKHTPTTKAVTIKEKDTNDITKNKKDEDEEEVDVRSIPRGKL